LTLNRMTSIAAHPIAKAVSKRNAHAVAATYVLRSRLISAQSGGYRDRGSFL
jgi:hypothetical protein